MTRLIINPKNLWAQCKAKNLTVTALAKLIGCARPSVYEAVQRPSRYPRVYAAILEALR